MKKNKTMAYTLAAALLVGGTFVGTKAYFTDNVQYEGELKISTGDLDISTATTKNWTLDSVGNDENKGTNNETGSADIFDNLKQGDKLTKTVEITNDGTLNAVITFNENKAITNQLPEGIEYTAKLQDMQGNTMASGSVLMPGTKAKIEFEIEVKVTENGKHNNPGSLNSNEQEEQILELTDSYELVAEQIKK